LPPWDFNSFLAARGRPENSPPRLKLLTNYKEMSIAVYLHFVDAEGQKMRALEFIILRFSKGKNER
jgi:hypothetical protein